MALEFGVLRVWSCLGLLGVVSLQGCKNLTGGQDLPAGTVNPSNYSTPAGARGMRDEVIATLESGLTGFLIDEGLLTDELEANSVDATPGELLAAQGGSGALSSSGFALDARVLPEQPYEAPSPTLQGAEQNYSILQRTRGEISQALGALATYNSTDTVRAHNDTIQVLRGELYALNGYAEILLADFFCSGVPLSTLDFQKDFTYAPSSTTDQVYQDAIAKEDSAIALANTNTQVLNLARVLKGRALLARGLTYATQAAQVVANVPDGFQYQLANSWSASQGGNNVLPGCTAGSSGVTCLTVLATVSDREGVNGLPYLSSGDPRTRVEVVVPANDQSHIIHTDSLTFPTKYNINGFTPFPVADWIEARLIQAEAALHANDASWLTRLNNLRDSATVPNQVGTLPPLADPGSDTARVSLLFHERAFWLFLTGHRQGDMRRLIRQYGRRQDQVYPIGTYTAPAGISQYGSDVTAPIPGAEFANSEFHGCLNRGA